MEIWTVGHSTHGLDEFLRLLQAHGIEAIADVRRFAGSRRYPHFNSGAMAEALPAAGIAYHHLPELGGRRQPRPDSPHTAWRNESFRGYADYMDTTEFAAGIERLLEIGGRRRTALMCAEAVWWRCHRGLISDYLQVRSHAVTHILSPTKAELHPYTSAAQVTDGVLSYRAQTAQPELPL